MTEQQPIYPKHDDRDDDDGLNWPRITGITLAIAVHVAALLLLLAPVAPPGGAEDDDDVTRVVIIEPPPPPAPPPPPSPQPPAPQEIGRGAGRGTGGPDSGRHVVGGTYKKKQKINI